jgi:hypothetical protein
MNKIMVIGFIVFASGFIVSGIGTSVGSNWSFSHPTTLPAPYAYSVGIAGLIILMAGIYIITSHKAS